MVMAERESPRLSGNIIPDEELDYVLHHIQIDLPGVERTGTSTNMETDLGGEALRDGQGQEAILAIDNDNDMPPSSDLLPELLTLPFERSTSTLPSPSVVLNHFSERWNMEKNMSVKEHLNENGFTTYEATLTIGVRRALGNGATISEAKEEASANCIKDLLRYTPPDIKLEYKPVVKTDPAKDILQVLRQACISRKWKIPQYRLQRQDELTQEFVCVAEIGELVEYGVAKSMRVGFRLAAVKLYDSLRNLNNSGNLPTSVTTTE